MSTRLYFAYGSNMLLARLRERVPGANPMGVAWLKAHALRWNKVGKDESGKCDMVASEDSQQCVYGVLYEIPTGQKSALDLAEGLGQGYKEEDVWVEHRGRQVRAFSYFALRISPDVQPFTWYRALVVAGAMENKLPPQYIDALRAGSAILDTDDARHAKNMRLASGV